MKRFRKGLLRRVMGDETSSAVGYSDPAGTSLQQTDCDQMTFRSAVPEVLKESLTFRLPASCGSCFLTRSCGSVFYPGVKRHQQADVWATLCWSVCRLVHMLLSAAGAQRELPFLTMLLSHRPRKAWCYEWKQAALISTSLEMTKEMKKWNVMTALMIRLSIGLIIHFNNVYLICWS